MSATLPSDEVAEDYKSSLEDLIVNDRNQIGVLTVIAKENTEHAQAIARVLENHIRSAPPARKLPALYVLDSIVKNVGTPYTIYFQRNLYQTFMGAYTLVDSNIRKKLDEMLRTWKEPVPGSLDTHPVFPVETVREIENALMKARNAALQQQYRTQSANPQMRATATPPSHWRSTPPIHSGGFPGQQTPIQPPSRNGAVSYATQQYPSQQYPLAQSQPPMQYPAQSAPVQPPATPSSVDLAALNQDLDNLVATARQDFAHNISDTGVQQRLKALLDLQSIVKSRPLPENQLRQIRDQVSLLGPSIRPAPKPTPPPVSMPLQAVAPTPPISQSIQQSTPQPTIPSFINSANLAELLRTTASRNQPTPPPQQAPVTAFPLPQVVSTPPLKPSTTVSAAAENPLIAQLRAAGLLPATSTPPATSQLPFTPPFGLPNQQASFQQQSGTFQISVKLTSASIKTPRPNLIVTLYDDRPNRCTTCGRRFKVDAEGKEKKSRHLDWHFKTNTRLAEAAKRGQSRSWYLDEREWISSKEYEDDSGPTENVNGANGQATKKAEQFILAPNDPALRNAPCPICQEKFESTWSEDVQEFIWKDALKVGNRIYHASCYREVTKDKEGRATPVAAGRARTATPDSVLGKRKAEDDMNGLNAKIKLEPT